MPASGKLTVAKELARLTGFKLFHNHLVVNALRALFEFGSPEFCTLREKWWREAFVASASPYEEGSHRGIIFTFCFESTVSESFPSDVVRDFEGRGGEVLFAEVACPMEILCQRMGLQSRHDNEKLTDPGLFVELVNGGQIFRGTKLPKESPVFDTSHNDPEQTARQICTCLKLPLLS